VYLGGGGSRMRLNNAAKAPAAVEAELVAAGRAPFVYVAPAPIPRPAHASFVAAEGDKRWYANGGQLCWRTLESKIDVPLKDDEKFNLRWVSNNEFYLSQGASTFMVPTGGADYFEAVPTKTFEDRLKSNDGDVKSQFTIKVFSPSEEEGLEALSRNGDFFLRVWNEVPTDNPDRYPQVYMAGGPNTNALMRWFDTTRPVADAAAALYASGVPRPPVPMPVLSISNPAGTKRWYAGAATLQWREVKDAKAPIAADEKFQAKWVGLRSFVLVNGKSAYLLPGAGADWFEVASVSQMEDVFKGADLSEQTKYKVTVQDPAKIADLRAIAKAGDVFLSVFNEVCTDRTFSSALPTPETRVYMAGGPSLGSLWRLNPA